MMALVGFRIGRISVVPDATSYGRVDGPPGSQLPATLAANLRDMPMPLRHLIGDRHIVVYLAGDAAVLAWQGDDDAPWPDRNDRGVHDLVRAVHPENTDQALTALWGRTRRTFRIPRCWRAVMALARALHRARELDGGDAVRVVRPILGAIMGTVWAGLGPCPVDGGVDVEALIEQEGQVP